MVCVAWFSFAVLDEPMGSYIMTMSTVCLSSSFWLSLNETWADIRSNLLLNSVVVVCITVCNSSTRGFWADPDFEGLLNNCVICLLVLLFCFLVLLLSMVDLQLVDLQMVDPQLVDIQLGAFRVWT